MNWTDFLIGAAIGGAFSLIGFLVIEVRARRRFERISTSGFRRFHMEEGSDVEAPRPAS